MESESKLAWNRAQFTKVSPLLVKATASTYVRAGWVGLVGWSLDTRCGA